MKKLTCFISVVLSAAVCLAAAKEATLLSKITSVTVYTDRAQVTRTGSKAITAGEQTLVFDNMPANLERSSIQVNGTGSAVIKDVRFDREQEVVVQDKKLERLYRRRTRLQEKIGKLDGQTRRATSEKGFVERIASNLTTGQAKEVPLELDPLKWQKMVSFYRSRLDALDAEVARVQKQKAAVNDTLAKVNREIQDLGSAGSKTKNQVKVLVDAAKAGKVKLNLSYIVYGPTWYPVYDLRVSSDKKKLNLAYNAVIRQNTSEDWRNVEILLSTAKVQIGGAQPELSPWYINFYQPRPVASNYGRRSRSMAKKSAPMALEEVAMDRMELAAAAAPEPEMQIAGASVQAQATSVVFAIAGKNSVLSDNQEHRVGVLVDEFDATFRYSAVPKLAQFAYLRAKVKNESEFPLLAGKTNIFLDNNYVSSAHLDFTAPGQEFKTDLGIDEGMKVEYKFIKKYRKDKGLVSKKIKTAYEYKIILTNNKKNTEEIVVRDQLPISQNKEIKVELLEPEIEEDTKNPKLTEYKYLKWFFKLEPGQKQEIPLTFTVEYPEGKQVQGIN